LAGPGEFPTVINDATVPAFSSFRDMQGVRVISAVAAGPSALIIYRGLLL